ncbi:MAG: succinate dehydrogenase [Archaeoglobaceae archaeon]
MTAKNVLEPLAWLLQILTGIAMVFLVTFHFLTTHAVEGALEYEKVAERFVVYSPIYVALLLVVVFHAFNGLRAILLDTSFWAKRKRATDVISLLLMLLAISAGAYVFTAFII